uniref:Uncharacterized protein n=1 Tax=Caenorhabditis japonica TaxID=281687 RepID=A0A8R1HHJ8_CAEJA
MHDELPVDIFRRIVAFSTTSRSILDLWRLNESAQHQVSKEVKKLSKKAPIRLDIQRFFRENNPFELEFYEIGDAEQKRRFHEKIRELARLLEQILEISGEFQIDNLTAEALGFQAEHDEQFMDRAPFMLQKKMMYILSKFNSSEISISTVFMRPSRVIRTFRNRFDTITALDLGNVKALSSLNLRSKVFPALVNLEKLAWSHANHTYLRKIPNKEKLRVLDVTCHIVGRPEWREFEFLQEFTSLERFYLGFTVPNKPTRFEMDILLNLYQSIWKFKMAPKNEQLLRNLPKIKELGFWNSPEKIFQLISKHSLSIDTLTFGSLSQNMTKLCSFDSILDSFFKFEQAEDLQPPEIGHLNMNLHAMPAVGLDYYLPNVMNYVNKLPCLKSVSLFVRCIFHAQMTSSWSLESNREKSSRRRPIFESNYTHFTFHSEGLCGRIIPVGSKGVAIIRTAEAPKKDRPFVQFAPAPADALAASAYVTPAGTLTITMSVFFGTPLKKYYFSQ